MKLGSESNSLTQQGRVVGSEAFQEEMGCTLERRRTGETHGQPNQPARRAIVL